MAIHAVCPHCSSPFVLGDEYAGQSFTCSYCKTQILLPEPAPQPLPPIDSQQIRRVVGHRRPLILFILGVGTLPEDLEKGPVTAAWSLRHLFLLLSLLLTISVLAGSAESAIQFGPFFLLMTAFLLLAGYIVSVHIADREIGHKKKSAFVARFILQPLLLPLADPLAALPALRLYFYTAILAAGTCLMGLRAGSFDAILPRVPYTFATPAAAPSPPAPQPAPTHPLLFNPDVVQKDLPASSSAPPQSATPSLTTIQTPPPPAPTLPAASRPVTDQVPPPPPPE